MFNRTMIRIKAMQRLYSFWIQHLAPSNVDGPNNADILIYEEKDKGQLANGLQEEARKVQQAVAHFLQVLVGWAHIDQRHATILLTVSPSTLVNNVILRSLTNNQSYINLCKTYPLGTIEELLESWYYHFVRTYPPFLAYIATSYHTPSQDRDLISKLIRKVICKHQAINGYIAREDIGWVENKSIVTSCSLHCIDSLVKDPTASFIFYTSSTFAEQELFYRQLVAMTIETFSQYQAKIATKSKNWNLTRIALLDRLLIQMILTEVLHVPQVPIRVSIDEYLEIAKRYSTERSAAFINGIADKLIGELAAND